MKILSPAGNFESLKMAVFNGADEVYLGVADFNARNNIEGFSLQTLKDAVDFAHIFGVKVHLAVNILFNDSELQGALDLVGTALNFGVDALIVQDLGLISLINKHYPSADVHLSTQMGLHNLEGVLALSKKYKFSRVVLSRETPLSEIKRIKENTNVEVEYFVQGALCVSFSGNCYLSSYLYDASGNRGKCKQLCRLPYTLYKGEQKLKKGYLLSAKDFNMIDRLADLKNAGVDAIKIEGRARRPYYVAVATKNYFNALHGKKIDEKELELAFNRTYTQGYFNGNGDIISNHQNHIGVLVGKVEKFIKGRKFNQVYFTSNLPIAKKSTLKFISSNSETTISAYDLIETQKGKYMVTTTASVVKGQTVHLIQDVIEEQRVLSAIKKVPIEICIKAIENQPIKVVACVGEKRIEVSGEMLLSAKSSPLTKEELKSNFEKSEYFYPQLVSVELGNVFIPKQKLNEFRRTVFKKIKDELTAVKENVELAKLSNVPKITEFTDFCIVENLDEPLSAKNVIYSPETYLLKDVEQFISLCKKEQKTPYLDTPNFALKQDVALLKSIIKETGIGIVANNYYALALTDNFIVGAGLNVYNSYTASELGKPFFSAEGQAFNSVKFAYMTLRHCPFKCLLSATCDKCHYEQGYIYISGDGKAMKLKRKKLSSCTFYLTD